MIITLLIIFECINTNRQITKKYDCKQDYLHKKNKSVDFYANHWVAVNICLIFSQILIFNQSDIPELSGSFFYGWKIYDVGDPIGEKGLPWIIPYFDGVASISRVVRVYPNYLIFKSAMLITSILLIKYWVLNKYLLADLNIHHKDINKFLYFGVSSAVFLVFHSIFLGIEFDLSIYNSSEE